MQVLVLGMHRSGTSMVTQILRQAGCYLGPSEELMVAMPDNPGGYCERLDVCDLNSRALKSASVDWNTTNGDEVNDLGPAVRKEILNAIRKAIHSFDAHRPWAIKDPRLSVVFPLWRPMLSHPVVVVCVRHPIEVAESLKGRDGTPLSVGMALWEVYNRAALEYTRGLPRVVVSHRKMMEAPFETVQSVLEEINRLGGGGLQPLCDETVSQNVRKKFYRSKAWSSSSDDLLMPQYAKLFAALESPGACLEEIGLHGLSSLSRDTINYYREVEDLRESLANAPIGSIGDRGLKLKVEQLQRERDTLEDRLVTAEGQLRLEQRAKGSHEERFNWERKARLAAEEKLAQLHEKHGEMGASYDHLMGEYRRVVDLLGQTTGEMDVARSELRTTQVEREELELRLKEIESERDECRSNLERLLGRLKGMKSELDDAHSWRAAFESRAPIRMYRAVQRRFSRLGERQEGIKE